MKPWVRWITLAAVVVVIGTVGYVRASWEDNFGAPTNPSYESVTTTDDVVAGGKVISGGTVWMQAGASLTTAIQLDALPAVNTCAGMAAAGVVAGENLVFGDVVYQHQNGGMYKADADATMPAVAIAVESITAASSGRFHFWGSCNHAPWSDASIAFGEIVYVSETAGGITGTKPSDSNDVVQAIGTYLFHDILFFFPTVNVDIIP